MADDDAVVTLDDERLFVYGFKNDKDEEEHYISFVDSETVAAHGLWTEAIIGKVQLGGAQLQDAGAEIDLNRFQRNRAFREIMLRTVEENVSQHPALLEAAQDALDDGATIDTCIIPFIDQRKAADDSGKFHLEDLVGYVRVAPTKTEAGSLILKFESNKVHNVLTADGVVNLGAFLHDKLMCGIFSAQGLEYDAQC
jgi:hypothetical protein